MADLSPELQRLPVVANPEEYVLPEAGVDLDGEVARFEHALIQRALDRTEGNKSQAADLLRVKRTTLIEKLKRLERV
jgi:DNA-binding NtrC family response regulator